MSEISFVFPHQLFLHNPILSPGRPVILIEEFLLFRVQPLHKQKLVLMRAAMRAYDERLRAAGFKTHYVDATKIGRRRQAFELISNQKISRVHVCDVADDWLAQDLGHAAQKYGWELKWYDSPQFLNSRMEIENYFGNKTRVSQAHFYMQQRKKTNVLMDGNFPATGKYSLDEQNRKKLPKDIMVPEAYLPSKSSHADEAIQYVTTNLPDAIGMAEPFLYAVTHDEAKRVLDDFLKKRFANFGPYEDAMSTRYDVIFHSMLSPLLNVGLLTPKEVLDEVLRFVERERVPINSVEGFIRQLIGWREYVRGCYVTAGVSQRTSNFLRHNQPLISGMWDGATGIEPVDHVVRKVLRTGYCHHIERLMILGNFLLLTQTCPHEVYHWFMALFIDAYDWVMVPNVYGMSQFADAGFMTTKPYVSGSNYILKMSDFKKGPWAEIWDGLYWRFISKNSALFSANPRTSMIATMFEKNKTVLQDKIALADRWLLEKRS